jgi:uncharacterized protein
MPADRLLQRLALFSEFAQAAKLGRTAIMKLCFFLQESKGVPLGYQFSIYSYGPFDSDVLADLTTAEHMNILKSNIVYYPSGLGYEYGPGRDHTIRDIEADFLARHRASIAWVLTNFGNRTAGDLELLSTTLFVAKFNNPRNVTELIDKVELIKPHFSTEQIQRAFQELVTLNVLRSNPN